MQAYAMIFDVGTSSLKAVLFDREGEVIHQERQDYEYTCPQPRWAEIDPQLWIDALWHCLAAMGKAHDLSDLQAISFTGQMHTAVLLDEQNKALSPSILWLDRRAEEETEELTERFGLPPYMLNSTYSLPKIYWMKKHCPELLAKAKKIIWPKDYLRLALTGKVATDPSEGIGAALLDWEKGEWAKERLEVLDISTELLPPIQPSDTAEELLQGVAEAYKISPKVKVFTGYGDIVALLGGAPHQKGRLVYSLGSSSMFFSQVDELKTAKDSSLYTLHLSGYYLFGGVSNTTGAALSWHHTSVHGDIEFPEMVAKALEKEPGCDGLCFLPYLAGERSPYWSDKIAGGFYGMRLQHDSFHMARAVMEGVAYSIRHAMDLYAESGSPIREIAMAAGGVRVNGWAQMISEICGVPVVIYAAQETVSKVLFALCRSGLEQGETFTDILENSFSEPKRIEPTGQYAEAYEKTYQMYRKFSKFASEA